MNNDFEFFIIYIFEEINMFIYIIEMILGKDIMF